MGIFKASVHYNDLKGSCAADDADISNATKWLKDHNYINSGEYFVGLRMFAGENHGKHRDPVDVTFLITDETGYRALAANSDEYKIRRVDVNMDVKDFLSLFKRFEITLSPKSFLEGKEC